MAVLSLGGLNNGVLVTLAYTVFVIWVMMGEKDDLLTVRISAIVVNTH